MKAAAIRRYKEPVAIVDLPKPSPGPGDLLVKMRAASVNPVDFKIRDGGVKALIRYSFPLILGNDLAGEVEAVGEGVKHFRPGDAIYARPGQAPHRRLRRVCAGERGRRRRHAQKPRLGRGGLATAGRAHGDVIVDYRTTPFHDVVRDQDMVFDTQGGDTLLRSFTCVKPGGVVVTVGGVPDAKFARAWGLSLPIQWALPLMTRKITRLAKQRPARFEYWFMKASGSSSPRLPSSSRTE